MAFYLAEEAAPLSGFTSHFFKRYNERLGLNLSNPIDIMKAFFSKGMYCTLQIVERNKRPHIIAFGVDGIRFAEINYDLNYVEWKTFVTRKLAYSKQNELEHELTDDLMRELEATEREENDAPLKVRNLKNRLVALPLLSKHTA